MRELRTSIYRSIAFLVPLVCTAWLLVHADNVLGAPGLPGTHFYFFERPQQANDLKMGTLEGRTFSLADLKGKVVLLNFWRKDCQFCTREKYYLKRLMRDVARPDLEAVCVNLWDNPSWVVSQYGRESRGSLVYATKADDKRWVIENRVRGRLLGYYVLNEANEAIYEIKGFPSTYVIDKSGRVVAAHLGMVEWTIPLVQNWLLRLLGSPSVTTSVGKPEYALPDWIDRLLTNNMGTGGTSMGTPGRKVYRAPRK